MVRIAGLVLACILSLVGFMLPAHAAGPVAGVAGVSTSVDDPSSENGSTGTFTIRKSTNTASYWGHLKVNGVTVRAFVLTKQAVSIVLYDQVVTAPTAVTVTINRGGLGPVSQTTMVHPCAGGEEPSQGELG